jgi:hypothetical protein
VNVPPYCGLPNLSHQFPIPAVAGVVVDMAVGFVLGITEVMVVVGVVVVVVFVKVDTDVIDVLQDAKTIDITIRQVSIIQIIPLFIWLSYYYNE